jgi:hypothetical protein
VIFDGPKEVIEIRAAKPKLCPIRVERRLMLWLEAWMSWRLRHRQQLERR